MAIAADEYNDKAREIGLNLFDQMIRRDLPTIAEVMKGIITGDVYRDADGAWKTKGRGPDSFEMNRLLPEIRTAMDDLEEWLTREGRRG